LETRIGSGKCACVRTTGEAERPRAFRRRDGGGQRADGAKKAAVAETGLVPTDGRTDGRTGREGGRRVISYIVWREAPPYPIENRDGYACASSTLRRSVRGAGRLVATPRDKYVHGVNMSVPAVVQCILVCIRVHRIDREGRAGRLGRKKVSEDGSHGCRCVCVEVQVSVQCVRLSVME